MAKQQFQFNIYRINIVDEDQELLSFMGRPLRGNADLIRVFEASARPAHDYTTVTERATIKWSLREYRRIRSSAGAERDVVRIVLARSVLEQRSSTVSDEGIEEARTQMSPPPAIPVNIIIDLDRHLVAIEHQSTIFASDAWRAAVQEITASVSRALSLTSVLRFEPVPGQEEILEAFRSFSKLVKLRVRLRMPNPEMSRLTERIKKDMEDGGIREYLHQMYNPGGLNTSKDALPYAAASLAQAGYKEGEVVLEGTRDGKREKVKTGLKAERASIQRARDYVDGALANAKSKEAKGILKLILDRIDELVPRPEDQ